MPFTRSFRALLRLTGLWALPWTGVGLLVGVVRWALAPELRAGTTTLFGWLLNHAVAYGALGLISGLYLGLLLAQVAQGASWAKLPRRRVALWSAVAGTAPALFFGALALVFGAPSTVFLPLAALGVVSGVGSSLLATSTHAVTAAPSLTPDNASPRLP
jgi:hypothetical protein